jgi:hypothetical protein
MRAGSFATTTSVRYRPIPARKGVKRDSRSFRRRAVVPAALVLDQQPA